MLRGMAQRGCQAGVHPMYASWYGSAWVDVQWIRFVVRDTDRGSMRSHSVSVAGTRIDHGEPPVTRGRDCSMPLLPPQAALAGRGLAGLGGRRHFGPSRFAVPGVTATRASGRRRPPPFGGARKAWHQKNNEVWCSFQGSMTARKNR